MARRSQDEEPKEKVEEIYVELLIRIDGSLEENRITTFKMPIRKREEDRDRNKGVVEFETEVLVKSIQEAVGKLI